MFVSPLRRSLKSAKLMFENHPNKDKIKFVVVPELTEILSKVCDIATSTDKEVY